MNARRVIWLGVSALAIASWFAAASTSGVRPPTVSVPQVRRSAIDRSAVALQSEIARLHDRLAPTASPTHTRDLFRFSSRPRQRSSIPAPVQPVAAIDAPAPVAPRPALKLIGIAEDTQENATVRTAIISGLGDLFLVKSGETFAGQYRVDQVSADAVQLIDTTTAVSTTLALH